MGAADFSSFAFGKTAQDAFGKAREQAQHDYGHAGYTGTVAEKHSFVLVTLPKGVTYKAFRKWLDEAQEFYYESHYAYQVESAKAHGVGVRKKYAGKTLKQWEALRDQQARRTERFWTRVRKTPGLEATLKRAVELEYGDKWGPALCVELTGAALRERLTWASGVTSKHVDGKWVHSKPRGQKLYHFTGYASS